MEEVTDGEIEASKSRSFRGTARVNISRLSFDNNTRKRAISEKNINRLLGIFKNEGCLRLDSENHVPVRIEEDILAQALAESRLIDQDLKLLPDDGEPHFLSLPQHYQLECLHGQHRVLAGKEYYAGEEEELWWTVKIFLKGSLSNKACISIQEQHPNSQPDSDGEIFQKIRFYHKHNNTQAENKWWARLTNAKQKDVKQLLKKEAFVPVLDELLEIPGLWSTVKLGTLHRFLTLKCDEEMLHSLRHILLVWDRILGRVPRSAIDQLTVAGLELRVPMVSEKDSREISAMMEMGHIFSSVSDPLVRRDLLRNLSTVPCLIPSMRVFLENLKYLEPCCNVLKGLINCNQDSTVRQCLFKSYVAPPCLLIERHGGKLQPATTANNKMAAYMQLWIYAMRNFPEMVAVAPKKELGQEKPVVLESSPELWIELSKLAISLGFRTSKALKMRKQNPDESIARAFLLRARPSTKYKFTGITIDAAIKRIAEILSMAERIKARASNVQLTVPQNGEPRDRRCGRPFENSQVFDQNFLFLPHMSNGDAARSGEDITSFFVKRDFLRSFLDTSIAVNFSQVNDDESNLSNLSTENTSASGPDSMEVDVETVTSHAENLEVESQVDILQNRVHGIETAARREVESLREQLAREQRQSADRAQAERECARRAENAEMAMATMQERVSELQSRLQQVDHDRMANDERQKGLTDSSLQAQQLRAQLETLTMQMREMKQSKQQMQLDFQRRLKEEQQKNLLHRNRQAGGEQQRADLMVQIQGLQLELENVKKSEELLSSQLHQARLENEQLQSAYTNQLQQSQAEYLEELNKHKADATTCMDNAVNQIRILESQIDQDRKKYQEEIDGQKAQFCSEMQQGKEVCRNLKLQIQALESQLRVLSQPESDSTSRGNTLISNLKAISSKPTVEPRCIHFEIFGAQPAVPGFSLPLDRQLINELWKEVRTAKWKILHPAGDIISNASELCQPPRNSSDSRFIIISEESAVSFGRKRRVIVKKPIQQGSDSKIRIRPKKVLRAAKKTGLRDFILNAEGTQAPPAPLPGWVLFWNPDWQQILDAAMQHNPDHVVATTSTGSQLTQLSFQTLLPDYGSPHGQGRSGWLDDEIVNAYMQLIVDDANKRGQKAYMLNSFFYNKLAESGSQSVEPWTKHISLDAHAIYIPVHQNNHWTMVAIMADERCIGYLDSLGGAGIEQEKRIREWLQHELGDSWVGDEWRTHKLSPRQENAKDCGVFAVTSAKMVCLAYSPLSYSSTDISTIRKKMAVELIKGEILREEEQL
ncbi:MAG: hypothetical protein M1839_008586 [Geoglossum umbratile]|nr:MAG: hypothetical protein M1839_008586 [Geoglossum umbratile]